MEFRWTGVTFHLLKRKDIFSLSTLFTFSALLISLLFNFLIFLFLQFMSSTDGSSDHEVYIEQALFKLNNENDEYPYYTRFQFFEIHKSIEGS